MYLKKLWTFFPACKLAVFSSSIPIKIISDFGLLISIGSKLSVLVPNWS